MTLVNTNPPQSDQTGESFVLTSRFGALCGVGARAGQLTPSPPLALAPKLGLLWQPLAQTDGLVAKSSRSNTKLDHANVFS